MKNCETCPFKGEGVCCQGVRKMRLMDLTDVYGLLAQGKALTAWNYDLNDMAHTGQEITHKGLKLHVEECSGPIQFPGFKVQRLTVRQVGVVR